VAELHTDIVFTLADTIGIAEIHDGYGEPYVPPEGSRTLGNPHAGCEICGKPFAGVWVVAKTWRCPAHPPTGRH